MVVDFFSSEIELNSFEIINWNSFTTVQFKILDKVYNFFE